MTIEEKEAIKLLEWILKEGTESAAMVKKIRARAMEDFMALCADEKSGWVPTSERLPKAGEYVGDVAKYYLVQNEYGDMMVARFIHSEYWEQIYQLKPIGDEIVAWRELPKQYLPEINVGSIVESEG